MAIIGNPILALEDDRELILFRNGILHPSLGGIRAVQGTVNTQTDTLSITNGKIVYTETDNDYGAVLCNNPIMLDRFNTMRITIDSILSWQDVTKFWASVYALSVSNPELERLNAYGYDGYEGNAYHIQESGRRVEGSFIVECDLNLLMRKNIIPYNISVTCASDARGGMGNASLVISDIRLLV